MAATNRARDVLPEWIVEALVELGGSGTVIDVCKVVWRRHETDLRGADDLFYTWQYDIRWAATKLRHAGRLAAAADQERGCWSLLSPE